MAVSETARKIVLDLCELCDVSWTESKAIEKIRAFRADGRDSDGAASAVELANMMSTVYATVLLSDYASEHMAEVAQKLYEGTLPPATRRLLEGEDSPFVWEEVATAILANQDLEGSEY